MPPTWYFPIGKEWVMACDWNPAQGKYNRNCRPMRKADIPGGDAATDMVSDVATVFETTKQIPPATWYYPTEQPDWVLSCDLDPATGRHDANPHRIRVADIGAGGSKQPTVPGHGTGLVTALGSELRRRQPLIANILLMVGALAAMNALGKAASALLRPAGRR